MTGLSNREFLDLHARLKPGRYAVASSVAASGVSPAAVAFSAASSVA